MLKRSTLIRVWLAALVVFMVGSAGAEVRRATVAVKGMACPFCAFGVEKRLKKVAGVGSVEVSAKEGTATLIAKKGQSIDVGEIPGAIKKAGFTPGTIDIEAVGRVSIGEHDRLLLSVAGSDEVLPVADVKGATDEKLRSFASEGAFVKVTGVVLARSGGLSISPDSVEEVGGD